MEINNIILENGTYPTCPYDCPCYKTGECEGGEHIKYCNMRLENECQSEDLGEIDLE